MTTSLIINTDIISDIIRDSTDLISVETGQICPVQEVSLIDSLYTVVVYTELGLLLGTVVTVTSIIVIPTITPLVAPTVLAISPLLYLGI
jgi:hypothetical protein